MLSSYAANASHRPASAALARRRLAAALLLAALATLAHADPTASVWQGGPTGLWQSAANWTPSAAFPNDDVNLGDYFTASVASAAVTLNADVSIQGLQLSGATLSGPFSLTTGHLGLSGANTFATDLTLIVGDSFAFATDTSSLTNHGTLQFNASTFPSSYTASTATLTNSATGTLRFNPLAAVGIFGATGSAFILANSGTVLADNSYLNNLNVPITQSATGIVRATQGTSLYFSSGGALSGTLHADSLSSLTLYGNLTPGSGIAYTIDQLAVTGEGYVQVLGASLSGSLASGFLSLSSATLSSFTNQSAATLGWSTNTTFAAPDSSLTNHGTIQFEASGPSAYLPSTATLTNSSTGTLRIGPYQGTSVGDSVTSPFTLANSGTILADNGQSNTLYTPVTQSATGVVRSTANSTLWLAEDSSLAGTLHADSGSSLVLYGNVMSPGSVAFDLDQLAVTGAGSVSVNYADLSGSLASGSLSLYSASLSSFTNQSAATLLWESGTRFTADPDASLTNHGTLQFNTSGFSGSYSASSATLTNSATGTLRFHPTSYTTVGDSSASASAFTLANSGTLLADNGQSNFLYVPVQNTGLILVQPGSELTLGSTFTQTSGEVRVIDASLIARSSSGFISTDLPFAGGTLRASGTVSALLSLADTTFELGLAQNPAALSVQGSVDLLPGATLALDLAGPLPALGHDQLAVSGDAALDGALSLRLTPAYAATLTPADSLTLLTAAAITGDFENVSAGRILTADLAGSFRLTRTATALVLDGYAALTPLQSWQAAHWPGVTDPLVIGPAADPDADGVANLFEYALGTDPTLAASRPAPATDIAANHLRLTFTPAVVSGLVFTIQASDNLSGWSDIILTGLVPGQPRTHTDSADLTLPAHARRFLRLRVGVAAP